MPERDLVKPTLRHTEWHQPMGDEAAPIQNESYHDPTSLWNRTDSRDDRSVTDDRSVETGKAMNSKSSSPPGKSLQGLKDRISFAKSKSLQQLLMADKEKLLRDRKVQHAKDIKAKLDAESKAIGDQKKADKELAKRYNREKKRREAEENRNNKKWGGSVRGFDPNAGLLRSAASEHELAHPRLGDLGDSNRSDSLTNILHPRLDKGQTWGVEHGSLGKRGRFGISCSTTPGNGGGPTLEVGDD